MGAWAPLLWVALVSQDELAAKAASSIRPASCRTPSGVWERARLVALSQQCDRLARAQTLLVSDPKQTLELTEPLVGSQLGAYALALSGQAHLKLGAYAAAFRNLEAAAKRDARVLGSATLRHDLSVAAALSGRAARAAEVYRTLLAERAVLPADRRARVLAEAALAELRLGAERLNASVQLVELMERTNEGTAGTELERALAALVRARAELPSSPTRAPSCPGLERALSEASGAQIPPEERLALRAIACEATEPERAIELWQKYAATELAAPWKTWTLARSAGLGR